MTETVWRVVELIAGTVIALLGWLASRLLARIDRDVVDLKQRVDGLEGNIGPRAEALVRVEQKLEDHIRREETITWKQLEDNAKQNQEAHAALLSGIHEVAERVVAVETLITNRIPAPRRKVK